MHSEYRDDQTRPIGKCAPGCWPLFIFYLSHYLQIMWNESNGVSTDLWTFTFLYGDCYLSSIYARCSLRLVYNYTAALTIRAAANTRIHAQTIEQKGHKAPFTSPANIGRAEKFVKFVKFTMPEKSEWLHLCRTFFCAMSRGILSWILQLRNFACCVEWHIGIWFCVCCAAISDWRQERN